MARAGLAPDWESVWANDFAPEKASIYTANWGSENLVVGDVGAIKAADLPPADMAWGSFPCQDLSLAGGQKGIGTETKQAATRSGSFWRFWDLIRVKQPPMVVLENVVGALSSNQGRDITTICETMAKAGYRYGPLVMDASYWVPQSRPRLFIVAIRRDCFVPRHFYSESASSVWHNNAVCRAYASLTDVVRRDWIWWDVPLPLEPRSALDSLIEENPTKWVKWETPEKTAYLISLMNDVHLKKIQEAQQMKRRVVGLAYRRTRDGRQRAEVRFDGLAGCLRTAGGGSSKQIVIEVKGERIRSRLLSPREAARLQGLPDTYWLPDSYNEAYDLVGDGLCVPVVAHLGRTLLTPLANLNARVEAISA